MFTAQKKKSATHASRNIVRLPALYFCQGREYQVCNDKNRIVKSEIIKGQDNVNMSFDIFSVLKEEPTHKYITYSQYKAMCF